MTKVCLNCYNYSFIDIQLFLYHNYDKIFIIRPLPKVQHGNCMQSTWQLKKVYNYNIKLLIHVNRLIVMSIKHPITVTLS